MTLTARELCHLGRHQELTRDGNEKAKQYYLEAVQEDASYLPAYAELSYVYVREYQNDWSTSRRDSLIKARRYADQAVALSQDTTSDWMGDFRGLWYSAIVRWNEGDFPTSFKEYEDARRLIVDPDRIARDTADLDADMAEAYIYYGDHDRAIELILDAMKRNPDHPYWYRWNLGRAYYMAKRYQDAIDEIARVAPNDLRLITAASKAQLGDVTYARAIMADFSRYDPDWTVEKSADYPYDDKDDRKHWLDGLRKAGLRER